MFIDELKTLIAANAGVQGQLGNPARVYAGTVLPRGYTLPAALIHKVPQAGDTDYTFSGTTGHREITVQLDIYADTEGTTGLTLSAIRAVLKNFRGILSGGSVVQAALWEYDGDMPWSAEINKLAQGFRVMAHIRFHYIEASS